MNQRVSFIPVIMQNKQFLQCYVDYLYLVFFSFCIAERARGMVGQLSRNAKGKKGEPRIACRRLSTGLESRTKNQKLQSQHKQKKQKTQKASEAGENPRKKGETIRAPTPLISSLPPCSVSALPSMWVTG